VTGIAIAAGGTLAAFAADLPQEPGPITGLGLAVLVGSGIRRLPVRQAWLLGCGSAVVLVLTWATALPAQYGFTAVTVLDVIFWAVAVVMGLVTRQASATCGTHVPEHRSGAADAVSSRT
jgi:hypothetical protein